VITIKALPTNIRIEPIPAIMVNLAAFLTIKQNVDQAAGQNDLLVKAI